ncbi:MAG TPA: dihydrodipicolinate synthase family protein [Selenomonadales bacterium]|nr:dihydrodipicolinate synthase family protein [Selenomonadales bacterium]
MRLKGVYPALVTPLTPEEKVDAAGLRRVVRYCLDGGVHGLLALGTTGEFPAMTGAMRRQAMETVLDEAGGKVPVLIGCGDTSTRKIIEQVRVAARTRADAVLAAVPYYYPLDQAAVERHFLMVAEASEKPVLIYNFPQMTKIAVAPDTLAALAVHPNIVGVKESSGDFINLQRFLDVTSGRDFTVMCGNPALGLAAYIHGARGGIYAACSLVPKLCAEVYDAYCRNDLAAAVALQKRASHIPLMGSFGPAAAVIKHGLSRLGICGPTVSAPLAVAAGQEEKIAAWMQQLGIDGR